jgi:K+-transporting ATPase ATPase B chain
VISFAYVRVGGSPPVIREAGGDRSAATGGTTVLSDWIKLRMRST